MNSNDTNGLDRWLHKALMQYGSAEAQVGLESRVLANLAGAQHRPELRPTLPRWNLAFAGLAAVGIVAVAIWVGSLRDQGKTMTSTSLPPVSGALGQNQSRDGMLPSVPRAHKTNRGMAARQTPRNLESAKFEMAGASPRLDQFPSQRPLSEQEQLLKTYVSQFPKEAAVIADEQAQREKEIEALYSDIRQDSDSEQER